MWHTNQVGQNSDNAPGFHLGDAAFESWLGHQLSLLGIIFGLPQSLQANARIVP
jgi:hypothetical protein